MIRFLTWRLVSMVPALFAVALAAFLLIRVVPGDAVEARLGERGVSAERLAAARRDLGLDQPLWVQAADRLMGLARGDLGRSLVTHQPVAREFAQLFPATAELSLLALALAVGLGVPLGALAAANRRGWIDRAVTVVSLTGHSLPVFWWGLTLIVVFSVTLGWTPVSGRLSLALWVEPVTGFMTIDALLAGDREAFRSACQHLILPAVTLATVPLAMIARVTRASMLEALGADPIRAARAKGLPEWRVVWRRALPLAMVPVVMVIGAQAGTLLGGAILTETIFAWPGVGKWLVDAVHRRDYPVIEGGATLVAGIVMLANLAADLVHRHLDPRSVPSSAPKSATR